MVGQRRGADDGRMRSRLGIPPRPAESLSQLHLHPVLERADEQVRGDRPARRRMPEFCTPSRRICASVFAVNIWERDKIPKSSRARGMIVLMPLSSSMRPCPVRLPQGRRFSAGRRQPAGRRLLSSLHSASQPLPPAAALVPADRGVFVLMSADSRGTGNVR